MTTAPKSPQVRELRGTASAGSGEVAAIWIKRARRLPMRPVEAARLVAGRGLEDNANQGGKRQVTVIAAEAWRAVEAELGETLDPSLRRANLMVRGLDLRESRGRILELGGCRLLVHGETRPCRLMEDARPGLQRALDPDWRGGVYAEVLEGGELRLGDAARWASPEDAH